MTVANKCLIFPKWHNNPHQANKLWLSSSDMPGQNRGIRCNYQESLKERHCRKSAVLSGADRSTVPEKWIEQNDDRLYKKYADGKDSRKYSSIELKSKEPETELAKNTFPLKRVFLSETRLIPFFFLLYLFYTPNGKSVRIAPSKNARSSDLASVLSAQVHLFTRYRVSSERWRRLRPKPLMHRKTKLQRLP